ncbi:MAG: hypothetical protein CVU39_12920 [Chloroflexi bacterium HGW-Chloroflexi-10]|nr:MAG: hypothetical protein CVU39_12920 [Chloroflexi bacterium HGW-Chloroflexi-10]
MKKHLFKLFAILMVLAMVVAPASANVAQRGNGPHEFTAVDPSEVVARNAYPDGVDKAVKGVTEPVRFIIQLEDAPLATYDGNLDGYKATSPAVLGTGKLDAKSPESKAYMAYLADKQTSALKSMQQVLGRELEVAFRYSVGINGFAVEMDAAELEKVVMDVPGIIKVEREKIQHLDTDVGPAFIGATDVWNLATTGSKGEGILVGIIDGGINFDHPSFAEVGPEDDYVHVNPLGADTFVGVCDPTNVAQYDASYVCNDKLIGAYSYVDTDAYELYTPEDSGGHGSHTASTVAGNVIIAEMVKPSLTQTQQISGVAPHANIIAYDVCVEDSGDGACYGAAINAAIDQAILDGVDVINFSISGGEDPYNDSAEQLFLAASTAGIFVAASAGNNGPDPETTGHRSPWLMSSAASTHNRAYPNGLIGMSGGDTTPPANMVGKGFTSALAEKDIVYAGDFGNALCLLATEGGVWDAGTDFTNKIVVCDRGISARVDKAIAVQAEGAVGYVLANNAASADALTGDAYVIPGVHITYADGVVLKTWLASGTGHKAAIQGATRDLSASNGNVMADFSSRGPNGTVDVLKPDVTAPGVDIWAAVNSPVPGSGAAEFDFYSGTSMSSPHTAGAAALLTALHPTWTAAEIKSALMLTAVNPGIKKEDGITEGDVFDFGAGLIQVDLAADTGLVMDEIKANFDAANPADGGNPQTLNLASVYNSQCLGECSWTRTVRNVSGAAANWTASVTESAGLTISVSPASFSIADGATQVITITANVDAATVGEWNFGDVKLTENADLSPDVHLPLAVLPSAGVVPEHLFIDTRRDAGSKLMEDLQALAITERTHQYFGLVKGAQETFDLVEDPTTGDPYDDFDQVYVSSFTVGANTARFVTEIVASTSLDLDLFVMYDDGSGAVEVAKSATGAVLEYVDIMDPPAGDYYVIVQNWDDSVAGLPDSVTLSTGVVVGDADNAYIEGPTSVAKGELFDLRFFWDEPDMSAGQHWYGVFTVGTDAAHPDNVGTVPVDIRRLEDDVTKVADVQTAQQGDIVTYTITIQPNVTGEDAIYMLEDTLPEGMQLVPGSITGGATSSGGKIYWGGVMPGVSYYEITTDATDPLCDTGFGGYVDLAGFGINPQSGIFGDTDAWTAFPTQNPFVFFGEEYTGLGLSDDGFLIFDTANNYAGSPWLVQSLPDPNVPNNVAAILWQDMEIVYEAGTKGVSLATSGPDVAIVEYDDIQVYHEPTQTYDMEAVIYSGITNGPGMYEMVFAYDNITGPLTEVTVGVENVLGDEAYTFVNADDASLLISDGTMVCVDYAGPTEPKVITYQMEVTTDKVMTAINELRSSVFKPGAKELIINSVVWLNSSELIWMPVIFR